MQSNPKISVITVVFNAAQIIEQTIKSIINQSYKNIEYIIIDGKSTDNTVKVIKQYDKHIDYWISEPDNGIYEAMNKGLKKASGDFIIFINAGDMFYSDNTLNQIPFNKYPDADIFYGETVIIDEETGEELGLRRKKLPKNLSWKHYKKGMVVCHQSILVKKSITPFYNTQYKLSADVDWVIRALKESKKTVFTNSIISKFLNGGISRTQQKLSLKERFIILIKYFGLPQTIISHLGFLYDNLAIKSKIEPMFRRNTFIKN